jgi:hypothetical protein
VLQFYLQRGLVQFWLAILQGKVEAVPHVVGVDVGPQVGPALVPQSLGQIVLFGSPQQTAALVKTLDIHLVGVDIPVRSSGGEREKQIVEKVFRRYGYYVYWSIHLPAQGLEGRRRHFGHENGLVII